VKTGLAYTFRMRPFLLVIVLSIPHIAVAKDYPLIAKIKGVTAETTTGRGHVGVQQVRVRSVSRHTAVQIDSRVYTSTDTCNLALAGEEYPARIDTKKGNLWTGPAHIEIHMRVAGNDCRLVVTGSEAGQ
jgi:hypothetical protein